MSTLNVDIVDPQSGVIVEVNGVNIFSYPSLHPTPPANSNNTALGDGALEADLVQQTTFGNTAVGYRSGYSTYAGQHNTSVGCSTLVNNQDGLFNTAIGSFAGENLTSGDNNVCLGYLSTPATPTSSNSITLGNSSISVIRAAVTTITSLSDERDKKEIQDLPVGLEFVEKLKPVKFVWNDRDENGKHDVEDFGFIAQDLKATQEESEASYLNLVYESNPEKLEASYGKLLPVLVKAIQEMSSEIKSLKEEVLTLKSK